MAEKRRQSREWWFERQRQSLLQRSESGEAGAEASAAGRWGTEEVVLRSHERYEEEADFNEDSERPE
jgi:hypothetical protein